MTDIVLAIDRLVLTDLNLAPHEAERAKTLIEIELYGLLQREGLPHGLRAGDVETAHSVAIDLSAGLDDRQLAESIARRIVQTLRYSK